MIGVGGVERTNRRRLVQYDLADRISASEGVLEGAGL